MKGSLLWNKLFFILCLVLGGFGNSCSKLESNQCTDNYALSGQLLDGKSGIPVAGVNVGLSGTSKNIFGNNTWQGLGNFTIIHDGFFNLNYKCNSNFSGIQLSFNVDSPYIIANAHLTLPLYSTTSVDLPANTNIFNLKYYMSDSGTLRIFVQPGMPLKPSDTLMVQILNKHFEIKSPTGGLTDSIRMPAFVHVFTKNHLFWGIGSNQLKAALKLREYDTDPHKIDFNLCGDPFPTDITIKF